MKDECGKVTTVLVSLFVYAAAHPWALWRNSRKVGYCPVHLNPRPFQRLPLVNAFPYSK